MGILRQTVASNQKAILNHKTDLLRLDEEAVQALEEKNELLRNADELERQIADAACRIQELEGRCNSQELFGKQIR